ncbi:flippase Wzx [Streptococcus pneumoniae]|nr:flippase Wzx [Streptococcus pneumoniae]
MERDILRVNALVMLISMGVTLVTTYLLNSLELTVVSIVVLLALRSIIAELILSKKLDVSVKKDIVLEFLLTLVFISSSWYLPIGLAVIVYTIAYGLYLYLKHEDIKTYLAYFKASKKTSN